MCWAAHSCIDPLHLGRLDRRCCVGRPSTSTATRDEFTRPLHAAPDHGRPEPPGCPGRLDWRTPRQARSNDWGASTPRWWEW